ncbi:hypothetical protein SKAU_G00339430 [Synaphobranchus kaupii]|uniref:Uncharacterized protein n=1 Tax=Synaphobranchus kaupii TaxID=118154 RepID=A0A9Q1EMR8_SYNKA|nr:hypothetical protein SKAU_G00339430 [Synaphobranchus kaupii]
MPAGHSEGIRALERKQSDSRVERPRREAPRGLEADPRLWHRRDWDRSQRPGYLAAADRDSYEAVAFVSLRGSATELNN